MAKCKKCQNIYNLSNKDDVIVGKWCPKINDSPDIERERECEHFKSMSNADKIRSMNNEELAEFLDNGVPSCTDYCPDFKAGCAFGCKYKQGKDFLVCWLQSEAE